MVKLIKNYLHDEDALSEAATTILMVVIGVAIIGVIAFVVYNIINGGKSDAEDGMSNYENIVGEINGLR